MIFANRWQLYFWVIVLGGFALLTGVATRTAWLAFPGLAVVLVLLLQTLVWGLLKDRTYLVLLVAYGVILFIMIGILGTQLERGDPLGIAIAIFFFGLLLAPPIILLALVIVGALLPMLGLRLFAIVGKNRYLYRGVMQTIGGGHGEAIASLTRHLERRPNDPKALMQRAIALAAQHRLEEAFQDADDAVRADRSANGLGLRGMILALLGAARESLADADAALEAKPDLAPTTTLRAFALISLRRLDDAVPAILSLPKSLRTSASLLALGDAYRLLGQGAAALDAYEKAERRAPMDVAFNVIRGSGPLAYALAYQGKLDKAEKTIRGALQDDPKDTLALYASALVQRQSGGDYDLEPTVQAILEVNPASAVSLLTDPTFGDLLAEERFRRLLARAIEESDRILARVRARLAADPA